MLDYEWPTACRPKCKLILFYAITSSQQRLHGGNTVICSLVETATIKTSLDLLKILLPFSLKPNSIVPINNDGDVVVKNELHLCMHTHREQLSCHNSW